MINELTFVVSSEDAWWLAENSTARMCEKMGMKKEVIKNINEVLSEIKKRNIRSNPISSMF
jgi:hypothetical protein